MLDQSEEKGTALEEESVLNQQINVKIWTGRPSRKDLNWPMFDEAGLTKLFERAMWLSQII